MAVKIDSITTLADLERYFRTRGVLYEQNNRAMTGNLTAAIANTWKQAADVIKVLQQLQREI